MTPRTWIRKSRIWPALVWPIAWSALTPVPARAQETMNGESATAPSPGTFVLKEQVHYIRLKVTDGPYQDRGTIEETLLLSSINVGLRKDLSLSLRLPVALRRYEKDRFDRTDQQEGVGDLTLLGKWRFWQEDSGPLNTSRLALLGGIDVRTGDNPFTSDAYSPLLGAACTLIRGRSGFNFSAMWKFTTGGNDFPTFPGESTADFGRGDISYLYRLYPKEFSSETAGAWYAIGEITGYYETNGDRELFLSPSLMYEGRTWALELSLQMPVREEVEHRPEFDFMVMAGLRFSF